MELEKVEELKEEVEQEKMEVVAEEEEVELEEVEGVSTVSFSSHSKLTLMCLRFGWCGNPSGRAAKIPAVSSQEIFFFALLFSLKLTFNPGGYY